ncbi:hypothetical protein KY345_02400 [Candidatus Woesearchaeota archaeon]|nr:hypothetical protein [Candidatus Woesearchaeota archaeon]
MTHYKPHVIHAWEWHDHGKKQVNYCFSIVSDEGVTLVTNQDSQSLSRGEYTTTEIDGRYIDMIVEHGNRYFTDPNWRQQVQISPEPARHEIIDHKTMFKFLRGEVSQRNMAPQNLKKLEKLLRS